jgi:hypothetical protein
MAAEELEKFLAYQSVNRWRDDITTKLFKERPLDELLMLSENWIQSSNKNVIYGLQGFLRGIIRLSSTIAQRKIAINYYLQTCLNTQDLSISDDAIAALVRRSLSQGDFDEITRKSIVSRISEPLFPPSLILLTPFIQTKQNTSLPDLLFPNKSYPLNLTKEMSALDFNKVLALARMGDERATKLFSEWINLSDPSLIPVDHAMLYVGGDVSISKAIEWVKSDDQKQRIPDENDDVIYIGNAERALPILSRWVEGFHDFQRDVFVGSDVIIAKKWLDSHPHVQCRKIPFGICAGSYGAGSKNP